MSTQFSLHVLYTHITSHSVSTIVVLFSASVCVLFWFNRRHERIPQPPAPPPELPMQNPEDPVEPGPSSATVAATKKRSKAQEKADLKTKKRIAKREAREAREAEAAARAVERRQARTTLVVSGSPSAGQRLAIMEQQHALSTASTSLEVPATSAELQPDVLHQETATASGSPRAVSPSPSETTTATNTTAVTVQSSTLVLTPPLATLPALTAANTGGKEKEASKEQPRFSEDLASEEDNTIRVELPTPPPKMHGDGLQLDIQQSTAPSHGSADVSSQAEHGKSGSKPKRDQSKSKKKTEKPPSLTVEDTANGAKTELPTIELVTPPIRSTENVKAEKAESTADTTAPRSVSASHATVSSVDGHRPTPRQRYGSSGGVGLGIPSSAARSSPSVIANSQSPTLPPRYQRRHQVQPGQPSSQPQLLPSMSTYSYLGPPTPITGVRSPTPSSPLGFPVAGPSNPWGGPYVGTVHPRNTLQHPMSGSGYATPPLAHAPVPIHPMMHASASAPFDNMRTLMTERPPSRTRSISASDIAHATDDNALPETAQDVSDSSNSDPEAHLEVDFPTLNPTPSKTRGRKSRGASGSGDAIAPDPASVKADGIPITGPPAPAWMNHAYPLPPPTLANGPFTYGPTIAYSTPPAYYQSLPFPYPLHPPSLPSSSHPHSKTSSPAWVTGPLPPAAPNSLKSKNAEAEEDVFTYKSRESVAEHTRTKSGGVDVGEAPNVEPKENGAQLHDTPHTSEHSDAHRRAHSKSTASTSSTSSFALPGTTTPSTMSSAHPSPRMSFGHLHPVHPNRGPWGGGPAPYVRPGSTPSPVPMLPGYFNAPGGYMPPVGPFPHAVWIPPHGSAPLEMQRSATVTGATELGQSMSPPPQGGRSQSLSRSSSPFLATAPSPLSPPPFLGYPGFYHGQSPLGPTHVHHPLATKGLPSTPGPASAASRQNSLPILPPIGQSHSRENTGGSSHSGEEEEEEAVSDQLMEAIFKNPESMKASSVGSGRSSRAGSQSARNSDRSSSSCGSPPRVETTVEE